MEPLPDRVIRIAIADDHAVMREMLRARLEREEKFSVVGAAHDADEAIRLACELRPDVMIMDIDMPGVGCFDAVRRINSMQPGIRIIFFSAFVRDRYIEEALDVGALGYVSKEEPTNHIVLAIKEVVCDRAYFSSAVRDRIVIGQHGLKLRGHGRSRMSTLTARERDVLRNVACGLPKKQIARLMHISSKTVDKHCTNLMTKLNIHDRVELARYSIREGLIEA